MEIILAFLVFFGGFTLGSMESGKQSNALPSAKIGNDGKDTAIAEQTSQEIYLIKTRSCNIAHTSIYRDLTRPYREEFEHPVIESGDCDEGDSDE